jgi:transposase
MRSLGLDVHKDFAEVAEVVPGKGVRRLGRVGTTPAALRAFAEQLGPDDQVALEATINTFAIAKLLGEHAGRVVISNPLRTRAIADAKIKTDKVDASVLAQLLAADYLPAVWEPDETTQMLRRLVARRTHIVRQRTRLKNQVHAILHRNLISGCPASDPFGKAGRKWMERLPLPTDEHDALQSNLRLFDLLGEELERADAACARAAIGRVDVRRLMTVPGIDVAVALALVAAIGDVHRFASPQKLVSYLGLDPRVRQSGNQPAMTGLRITKVGRSHARDAGRSSLGRGSHPRPAARLLRACPRATRTAHCRGGTRTEARRAGLAFGDPPTGLPVGTPSPGRGQVPASEAAGRSTSSTRTARRGGQLLGWRGSPPTGSGAMRYC